MELELQKNFSESFLPKLVVHPWGGIAGSRAALLERSAQMGLSFTEI